ncbi:DegT/DnrJ/EryC1/StrS family aminotransferase [Vibrio rhizosphaerae]|uniref:DegT/DnrJ/EryC1/StrS family aminotransferase n=1 Tax=Vibrio rhizosphaerae TaxID=398736 RepID=UPI00056F159E|nr:DegT/DnrJ/EryC1/StrS family aminotransferase [Vibrio rhizosphaerae]
MIKFPLMRNNILREDLEPVIQLLQEDNPILTNGPRCREFEAAWSEWLGVKYSVFVSSGSSANLLSMAVLKIRYPEGGEVIVPPLTWISDVASVLHCGFTPVFADINPQTLGMDTHQIIDKITDKTRAVFLSHIQGFNGLTDELLHELKRRHIPLIEDVCESHGATHNGQRVGSFGDMSNFSFYYAHHMSTIEGGMICTNDYETYQQLRMLRGHGMVRESTEQSLKDEFILNYPELNKDFIFAYPAYNVRNNEIGGILGLSQLKRLDDNVRIRTENQTRFFENLDSSKYRNDFNFEGSSNYAFNVVLKEKDDALVARVEKRLQAEGIEYRRGSAGGGNQLRQPYLRGVVPEHLYEQYPQTEHIHFYGFYIGNFPDLQEDEIDYICKVLNEA